MFLKNFQNIFKLCYKTYLKTYCILHIYIIFVKILWNNFKSNLGNFYKGYNFWQYIMGSDRTLAWDYKTLLADADPQSNADKDFIARFQDFLLIKMN